MDEEGQKEITQIINDQFKKLNAEFDSENPLSRFYKLSRSYFSVQMPILEWQELQK